MTSSAASVRPESPAQVRVIGGRYHVEAPLGKGGTAQIYRVHDAASGKPLALKQLHRGASAKLIEMFEREYQTLASFDHPHTVRVYEFGHDPSGAFYTMELLEGEDLGGSSPLSWRSACRYLADAASALALLHARSLIHRDVSPRNLWRTPDDRVKLIDFGALARFGVTQTVTGTPPCVPPEALEHRGLDQRADLYGLGAVAYYLLTGRHAYPARDLSELHGYWSGTPLLPSQCVARLGRSDLEPIPRELDTLVLSLLQHNPLARPSSCAEVQDRLHSLLGQTLDGDADAALARLTNTAFAGRVSELSTLQRQLELVRSGRGQVSVIEGASGMGSTRLMAELAQRARVERAAVIELDAAREPGGYGVMSALVLSLLETLPERAREAMTEHASVLAHLPDLRERLEAMPAQFPPVPGELRVRLQAALSAVLCNIARARPLLVMVDGLQHVDDESAACLHRLALEARSVPLMLVCTLVRNPGAPTEQRPVERALLKVAQVLTLAPLHDSEQKALLQSVFGGAEHLTRLSARLYRIARGNPGHTLELCRQLVQRGAITLMNGTWVLPLELSDSELQQGLEQAHLAGLAGLPDGARQLLRVLSVCHGPLPIELIELLAGPELAAQLPELLARELLLPARTHLVFANEQLRLKLQEELPPDAARDARKRVAEHTLASASASQSERVEAGLHLLASGDQRGAEVIVAAAKSCLLTEVDRLLSLAPTFEAALELLKSSGRPESEQLVLLAALARAGYETDPHYSVKYGEQAIRALDERLELPRARRWRKYLGHRLSFFCALSLFLWKCLRDLNNPCVPGVVETIQLLVVAVFATTATRLTYFDPDGAERCTRVLEPLTAMGKNDAGTFMYEYCCALAETGRDRSPHSVVRWQKILTRLASPKRLRNAPPELDIVARGGALYALGSVAAHRDDNLALRAAEQLDGNGYALNQAYAAQVRAVSYGFRGMLAEYAHCKERVEQFAIQHGTSWQTEVWVPGPESALALLLHDALAMKRAAEQMKRLSTTAPSLRVHARHMYGSYLLLHNRCAEAVPWLEDCLHEAPLCRVAWGRSHGVLARAYNRLKMHEKARAACQRVLDHFDDENFDFAAINLIVLTELAIAEAHLGEPDKARARIEQLLPRFRVHQNPLTLGHLHETLLELALIAGDQDEARAQFAHMKALFQSVASSSLMQRCDQLQAAIDKLAGDGDARSYTGRPDALTSAASISANVMLLADQLMASQDRPLRERAEAALRALAASVGASRGALGLMDGAHHLRVTATLDGVAVSPSLEAWMAQRLDVQLDDPDTIMSENASMDQSLEGLTFYEGSMVYRLVALSQGSSLGTSVIGVAALGGEHEAPSACPAELLRLVGELLRTRAGDA